MENMTFGQLLEKLLYLSNQKKSCLAKEVGYDISYISKWINSKNLPSTKNINKIAKVISEFIVNSLDQSATEELIKYFEIDLGEETNKQAFLVKYIEQQLKKTYLNTTTSSSANILDNGYSQDGYNSVSHVNPMLKRKYIQKEMASYMEKGEQLNVIISLDMMNSNKEEKQSMASMKNTLYGFDKNENLKIHFLTSFMNKPNIKNDLFDSILILNMISSHPSLNLKIYNCDVPSNTGFFVIKNKISYLGVYKSDGRCMIANISKEKSIVNELYYSLEDIYRNQGNLITDRKISSEVIKENTYMEYIMGNQLRVLIGTMTEFFMPEDLFMEVAHKVFGDDEEVISELKKINIFLQNITYKSKLRVLMYESEIRKYISSGELHFFNIPVTLTFKQRERHIKYIEQILAESKDVEIRLIDGKFIDEYKIDAQTSLFLSRNLKIIKTHPEKDINQYAIVTDNEFKSMCHDLFEIIWDYKKEMVLDNKDEILEKISKSISYTRIINEKFEEK